ncbi:uncharacterized protein CEXT_382431 [Caerostris extrusa]|uniref:Uncharacterized protein n=1 Tax=Caerostris extrusa TaxID=172846 RepID=A0AAV4PT87_CAEEX|nr:uncharacterized protein CEXT_382431 [Caerostris extrusa]
MYTQSLWHPHRKKSLVIKSDEQVDQSMTLPVYLEYFKTIISYFCCSYEFFSKPWGEKIWSRLFVTIAVASFLSAKPKHLKEHDIVKDKLYLHQLNGIGSQNTNLSMPCTYSDYVHMTLKQDPETLIRYHHSMPDCFSRNCLPYVSGRKGHVGMHAISSSKNRQLYIPDYVAPMRKLQLQNPSDYEFDVLRDDVYCPNVPWSKQCCPFSDDMRRQNQQSDHDSSSKISFEGSSKNKKKKKRLLPIIDPKKWKEYFRWYLYNITRKYYFRR